MMFVEGAVVVILMNTLDACLAMNWCSISCDFEGLRVVHLRCKVDYITSSKRRCTEIAARITPIERREILQKHNALRNNVNLNMIGYDPVLPKPRWNFAGDMRQLVWDRDLERTAQIWSAQCFLNRTYVCVNDPHVNVSMTVASFSINNHPDVVGVAFDIFKSSIKLRGNGSLEKVIDNFRPYFIDPKLKRFTTLIWASTWRLGCSKSTFKYSGKRMATLVCLYAPAGNIPGQRIFYKDTKPCGRCPRGTQCKSPSAFPNLCARPEDPTRTVEIFDWGQQLKPSLYAVWVATAAQIMANLQF